MKKKRFVLLALLLALFAFSNVSAEEVTLRTVSCFAGEDAAAEVYVEILNRFEQETGNTVLDTSSTSDEAWKSAVLNDFAAGNEPDILFFFAAGADSAPLLSRVVPLDEINREMPEASIPENETLREADGKIYAVPVRGYWEGLYVNTDLFEAYSAPLPENWESLMQAVRIFRENGIVPIAVSLSDIPHYLAEMAILACAGKTEQQARPRSYEEVPESWVEAMGVIRELTAAGAFADNASATYESASTALFLQKKAAMQLDGSWLVSSIPPERMDEVAVLPMPSRKGGGTSDCYIGGVSMGFYLTRRAWESPRRDTAVRLLAELTSPESLQRLGNNAMTGRLLSSAKAMQTGRNMVSPLQDAMNKNAREVWLLECIPAVAEGTMTAEECWKKVMALMPFGE